MNQALNGVSPTEVPGYKVSPYLSIFFLIFMVFGAFFIINLFVGVVISTYNREIDKDSAFLKTKK